MDEVKKRRKERYLQLKKEHGWSEDEMALSMKSGNNQSKNIKKGSKGKYFKGRCNHCGKFGHKKADCWDLKNKKEKHQENEKKVQKDKSKVRCFKCGKLGHYCWKPSSLLSNVHFRNTTKIAVQVLLLLTLFTFTFEPFLKL